MRRAALLLTVALLTRGDVQAQTTPGAPTVVFDGSLGEAGGAPAEARPSGGVDYRIEDSRGRIHGPNLFHSFSRFDVGATDSATFLGPDFIQNVVARVTGGSASSIDGLVRSEIASADLYLLNPAGIVFGPQATLDVKGSFHASTADFLRLGQDAIFSAADAGGSVLSLAPPTAFGFLGAPPPIAFGGLSVPFGERLSLVGGALELRPSEPVTPGAYFDASGGLTFVSVGSAGEVKIGAGVPDVTPFEALGPITLLDPHGILLRSGEGPLYVRAGSLEAGPLLQVDAASIDIAVDGGRLSLDLNGEIRSRGSVSGMSRRLLRG
jgi:filamentous hemagglutinin family protein